MTIKNLSTANAANLIKRIKNATDKNKIIPVIPGIDSKAANMKLCQYLITIPGSEKAR